MGEGATGRATAPSALFRCRDRRAYVAAWRRNPLRSPPMPVTARLSQLFYERLGEQIAHELVDWFNAVDATYRSDLREINELNFARFDAKLEQRVAGLDAKIEQRVAQLEAKIEQRVAQLGARIDKLETKLDTKLEAAVAQHAFAQLDAKIET